MATGSALTFETVTFGAARICGPAVLVADGCGLLGDPRMVFVFIDRPLAVASLGLGRTTAEGMP